MDNLPPLVVRQLGQDCDYEQTWQAMKEFTDYRTKHTADELWVLEHPPVFTQGQAGKAEHVLAPGDIPVIQVDRGGQVTYHGPGQLVIYVLVDLKRLNFGVRQLVTCVENAIIGLLAVFGLESKADPEAPGVYVNGAKIAQVGMRIRNHCSFHGLSLNMDMDLEPFGRINPCGYAGQPITRLADLLASFSAEKKQQAREYLQQELAEQLGYTSTSAVTGFADGLSE